MVKDELLSLLFHEYTGNSPESLTVMPKSGSDRIYCRMVRGDFSVLGVWNPSRKENDAFTGYAKHFRDIGLRVPGVFRYLPDEMVYLAEDLGDLDLYAWVTERKNVPGSRSALEEMYKNVLRELVRFQFDADKSINYDLAHPRRVFDRSSVMWDLYYFKYMFLKLSGTGFNEQALEEEFVKLADRIENVRVQGFLYRDFQSRNIMIKGGIPWFIDFQGGRKGAPQYDVASLLLDPYVELDRTVHDKLLDYYYSLLEKKISYDRNAFMNDYPVFGIVRLLQALGAYGFRGLYERKPNFTESIPPAVRQLRKLFDEGSLRKYLPEMGRIIDNLATKWIIAGESLRKKTTIIIESFGFRKGIPETLISEGGFMFDCRHLTDPYEIENLRSLTGRDKPVIDFLDDQKDIQDMIENSYRMITGSLDSSGIDNIKTLRVCFGCVSGSHRSVYCAEKIASLLKANKTADVFLLHHEIR